MLKRRLTTSPVQQPPHHEALDAIGAELRAAREARGEPLPDIAAFLRIRPHYLEALERGDAEGLPARPYALGFLRAYADHLGLDGASLVARMKASSRLPDAIPQLVQADLPREHRRPAMAVLVASLLLAAGIYGGYQLLAGGPRSAPELVAALPEEIVEPVDQGMPVNLPGPTTAELPPVVALEASLPPVVDLPLAAELTPPAPQPASPPDVTSAVAAEPSGADAPPAPTRIAALAVEGAAPPVAGAALADGRVVLLARESSWIQVRSTARDFVRTRTLQPGERLVLPDRADLALWTGNAGGVELLLDGQSVGVVGARGAVVRNLPLAPDSLKQRTPTVTP